MCVGAEHHHSNHATTVIARLLHRRECHAPWCLQCLCKLAQAIHNGVRGRGRLRGLLNVFERRDLRTLRQFVVVIACLCACIAWCRTPPASRRVTGVQRRVVYMLAEGAGQPHTRTRSFARGAHKPAQSPRVRRESSTRARHHVERTAREIYMRSPPLVPFSTWQTRHAEQ